MNRCIGTLLLFLSCCASSETLQIYTADHFESPEAYRVWQRLDNALGQLGYDSELKFLPNFRSLKTVNTEGDFELYRVAQLKEIAPKLTTNLIRVPVSIMSVRFFAVSLTQTPKNELEDKLAQSTLGLQKDVLYLKQRFADQKIVYPVDQIFKMLDLQRIDYALCAFETLADLQSHKEFKPEYQVEEFHRLDLFTFMHKKHAGLLPRLTEALKNTAR